MAVLQTGKEETERELVSLQAEHRIMMEQRDSARRSLIETEGRQRRKQEGFEADDCWPDDRGGAADGQSTIVRRHFRWNFVFICDTSVTRSGFLSAG